MRAIIAAAIAASLALTGCATTKVDPNYAVQLESVASVQRAQLELEKAKVAAEAERYAAIAAIAQTGDSATKGMAMIALAMGGGHAAAAPAQAPVQVPARPVSAEDRALQWAQVFAGPVTNIAAGYFGYKLGVTQSNNATQTTLGAYDAFSNIAGAGFASSTAVAGSAFATIPSLASMIQAPQPNITISGSGVVGDGTYTGANSGANSGNSGTIGNENYSPKPVTTTTTTTTTNCSSSGGSGGGTGAGGSGGC